MDYYSSYFKIDPLKDQTAREVIRTLKRHFLGCGIPNKLMSDNGLSFNSYEFRQFSTNYDMLPVLPITHRGTEKRKMLSRPLRVHWRNLKLQDQNLSSPTRMLKHALWRSIEFPSTKDVRAPNSNTDTSELLKLKIVEEVPGKLFKRKQPQGNTTISVPGQQINPANGTRHE